jgi:hypothetical protein
MSEPEAALAFFKNSERRFRLRKKLDNGNSGRTHPDSLNQQFLFTITTRLSHTHAKLANIFSYYHPD